MKFKKDAPIYFYLHGVHHNPNEWQQPDKFLPERFDPESELFKTPDGKARNPMSHTPFLFGERGCLGYQFAKVLIPFVVFRYLKNFELEI